MIQVRNLSFGYQPQKLLYKNLTLDIPAGSIYGLLGKNGAGKSTLLKNISGLLFPLQGSIAVNEYIPKKRLPSFLKTIYLIPEEVHVPSVTIKRYKELFTPFYPGFDNDNFNRYLLDLEITGAGKLNTFSFGQQKKFIIAFALACNTNVLLLDEPTNGLDIPSKSQFRKLIASVMNEDRIIMISTHQIRDLENLIDRVLIIDKGELLLNSSISEVSEKLCFKTVNRLQPDAHIMYAEESFKGTSIVYPNTTGEETPVDLEHLFNAVTENAALTKSIFLKA